MEELLRIAEEIAKKAHDGQVDKVGVPYITHPVRVAASCGSIEEKIVALLHDVVEDTPITLSDLKAAGMPGHVTAAVDAITKRDNEKNIDYLERVKANPIAKAVKLKDLADNFSPARFEKLSESDKARLAKKYSFAIEYLGGGQR